MIKRKRIVVGVLLVVVCFAAIVGIRSFSSSSEVAGVERNETSAPTKDGSKCSDPDMLAERYKPDVTYNSDGTQATITVARGTFRATAVSAVNLDGGSIPYTNLISVDPTTLGRLTKNNSMTIPIVNGSEGTATIHFVVDETDDTCLAYDETTINSSGGHVGTYEFDVNLELVSTKDERGQVQNTNYDGICRVFRTGEGYDEYKDVLNEAGNSKSNLQKYNYNAVNDAQKATYNNIISYCVTPGNVNFNYTEAQTASLIASAIRVIRSQESSGGSTGGNEDFMAAFNDAKSKALELGHDYSSYLVEGDHGRYVNTTIGLTCAWDKTEEDAGEYYVNKDYYYAKETDTDTVNYTYHYTSGDTATVSGGTCTRECEESVVVEYGAPVASKAGLCFEYKVRVTSRVVCNSSGNINPPSQPSVCTPTPLCNSIPGLSSQAGPNEDFDQCIMECDGGEYSDSCSQKCYDEVYGGEDDSIDPLSIRYGDVSTATQMAYGDPWPGYAGSYAWEGNNIVWRSSTGGDTYGRWYQENQDARTQREHGTYYADGGGFKRHWYGDHSCSNNCVWIGCDRNSYLNDSDAAADYVKNMELYNQAINSCSAAASCTTKTGEFTIGVTYKDDKGNNNTIDFPLVSSGVDSATLPSRGEGNTGSPSGSEIFIPDTNELGYAGCYEDGAAQNWYQVEWSFPGTWINNKTGDISFTKPGNENAWHYTEDKFCMPLNAQSTNVKWWQWKELTNGNPTCYTAEEISDSIEYNIHATARKFGYFGWNFNIDCFYGLFNEVPPELDEDGCPTGDTCDPEVEDCSTIPTRSYAFRIVDLNDLFPESANATDNNSSSLDITGRQPGYNWTLGISDADSSSVQVLPSLSAKNPDYKIDPISLIRDIQNKGNSIYSGDEELDYQVTLDTETLRSIREDYKDKSYTTFDGSSDIYNGVTSYRSKLLNELESQGAVSERGTPGVNNE